MKKRFFEWLIAWMMPGYHVHIHRTRVRKEKNNGNEGSADVAEER